MKDNQRERAIVIFTGTDPESGKGGIGVVLPGYFYALKAVNMEYDWVSTYHPVVSGGKWRPWLRAFPALFQRIRRAQKQGKRVVVYSHAGDGVSFFRETCILWFTRILGARTLLQIHSPKVDGYLDSWYKKVALKTSFVPADRVCVLTQWWKNRLRQAGIGKTISVIANPLPPELLKVANSKPTEGATESHSSVTVLSMARLVAGKGVDVMIHALVNLPARVQLVIAGDGEQKPELQRLVEDLGLGQRVRFAGWVSGQDKARLLERTDIFCLPSTYDAFPMSMVEAMAHGLPVVAVKWGGIPDMVADGRVGFLADEPRPEAIAEAIEGLLDKDRRLEMGREAKRWVLEISEPERVGQRLKELIEELIA